MINSQFVRESEDDINPRTYPYLGHWKNEYIVFFDRLGSGIMVWSKNKNDPSIGKYSFFNEIEFKALNSNQTVILSNKD